MVLPANPFSNQGDSPAPAPLAAGLYVVATPIGNLGDLSQRACRVLADADIVLAEDTRMARRLLGHIGASPRLETYNDHNAARVRDGIVAKLQSGAAIALTTDAGTPLISDPGFRLVDAARAAGIAVHAVPGPSAVTAALSVSGLATDRFLFLGFPPPKAAARQRWIDEVAGIRATLVIYESPRRLAALLRELSDRLGPRPSAVARELTKLHEEVRRGTLVELAAHYAEAPARGEIVVLIGWAETETAVDAADLDAMLTQAMAGSSLREAVDAVAAETGIKRRDVYQRALRLRDGDGAA